MDPVSSAGSVNLDAPAASLLRKLAAALPPNREFVITVFGSAPIQIMIDSTLTSADVDVFSGRTFTAGTSIRAWKSSRPLSRREKRATASLPMIISRNCEMLCEHIKEDLDEHRVLSADCANQLCRKSEAHAAMQRRRRSHP